MYSQNGEITFPVRLAKNCKAKFEQLWRVEQIQLFWTKDCVGGYWKVFGSEFNLGQVVVGEVGISSVQTITSSLWIGEEFKSGKMSLCNLWSALLIHSKRDFLSYIKETCSTSYWDFTWWFDLLFFIKNINEKKKDEYFYLRAIQ